MEDPRPPTNSGTSSLSEDPFEFRGNENGEPGGKRKMRQSLADTGKEQKKRARVEDSTVSPEVSKIKVKPWGYGSNFAEMFSY